MNITPPPGQNSQPQPGPQPLDPMQAHMQALAQYSKTGAAVKMLDSIRQELTKLTQLGDAVSPDDVIKGAGRSVAAGATPQEMAGILSDMPENSQALAQWVQTHLESITQREAQVLPAHVQAQHQVGVTGLQAMMHQHVQQQIMGPSPGPS